MRAYTVFLGLKTLDKYSSLSSGTSIATISRDPPFNDFVTPLNA